MIKFETNDVWGFEWAFKGMRNPMNSWNKSDSNWLFQEIGESDLILARRLIAAGSEHRKFLRQIYVSVDITAPMYFFKEFDTYKVGTVANSCSTMHKITEKAFTIDDFSHEHLVFEAKNTLQYVINSLNSYRDIYKNWEKQSDYIKKAFDYDKTKVWWQIIQLLPSSYMQKRTITMTYENIYTMRQQRKGHKLDEWRVDFFKWSDELPHLKELFN